MLFSQSPIDFPRFDGILYTEIKRRKVGVSSLRQIECAPDLTEQVYERLLEAICIGELVPETRLTQQELAASLNVSRQPVLQALRMLRKDGFVIDSGRRGLMVAPLDARLIEQTYQVRAALDGLAAREAATRKARLDQDLIRHGVSAANSGRIAVMIEADLKFHQALYDASGNPLISEAASQHWQHIRRAMGAVLMHIERRDAVWDEHAGIVEAINAGDAARAEKLARAHGENAGITLAGELERVIRQVS